MDEIKDRTDELLEFKARQDAWAKGDHNPIINIENLRKRNRMNREYAGLKRAMEKDYEQMYSTLLNNGEMDFIEGRKRLKTLVEGSTNKIPDWVIVTVNVDETKCQCIHKLHQLVEKYTKRIFIAESIFCLEQRGRDDSTRGKGMHAHILIRQTAGDGGQFRRDTRSSFKKLTDHAVHFRYIHTEVEQAIPYIKGTKKDEAKDPMIAQDKMWRAENNIKDWYENLQT